ncbi:alpha/beta-hydrolase [Aspergillus vadensis CBS 113365]|uniref:Alpha/beta-hydrolase n=1 Tax=Aspergillus vadensis (strain CBS 113365 / IMI 142717 / IBT 24658) TaxID=1448311 RepID=A0A319CSP9_ASPVC|nr:alpha/beta-hydrolase [Aspergillus vadensis CBS 113365]PYH71282.1 alpha/beta-hydrolase [Aspergillus vadensis CBS 113365]
MLFLPYELTPTAQYPHQMKQAVALLQYVIEDLGKRPSDIVLLGDSAGAHLILSVLSHLAHPHPHIPPLLLREKLAGALLLSPWMGESRTDYDSCRRNASRDLVSPGLLNYWADMFLGDAEFDSYNRPAGAPEGWWRDLPVEEIFIGVGGYEVLYDSIIKTARKIKAEHTRVTISIAHLEVHCEALSPFNPGVVSPDQYRALLACLKGTLYK